MFVDMNGSTAMKQNTNEVYWRGACALLFDTVFRELDGLAEEGEVSGTPQSVRFPVTKYLGDGVMAVFANATRRP